MVDFLCRMTVFCAEMPGNSPPLRDVQLVHNSTRLRLEDVNDDPTARLGDGKYLSLTTFRKTGTPVATPVWVMREADQLYVITGAESGKIKRLRNNTAVLIAACDVRGPPPPGPAGQVGSDRSGWHPSDSQRRRSSTLDSRLSSPRRRISSQRLSRPSLPCLAMVNNTSEPAPADQLTALVKALRCMKKKKRAGRSRRTRIEG